jgi:hypothetical protein
MSENKNLVQEALIQMKNVEDVIAENAKGILASTMKEEISQLVKESLNEQEDEEIELDAEFDTDEVEDDADNLEDMDSEESEDEMEFGDEDEMEFDDEEETIDLTNASAEDILTIFKRMSDEDGIIVQKDGDEISIKDSGDDVEYLVKMNEQEEEDDYEEVEDEDYFGFDGIGEEDAMLEQDVEDSDLDAVLDALYNEQENADEEDEVVYEIVMDEEDTDMSEMYEEDEDNEGYNLEEAKMTVKPKGVGMGNPKFKYGSSLPKKGFSDDKKEGPKTMGTGKAKFEFKEGQGYDDKEDEREGMKHGKIAKKDLKSTKSRRDDAHFETRKKKEETKEAARTYGMGSKEGRGLRKGITNNRNYTYESVETEMNVLREKNEEYRKALNVFREKLNEVAVFNSNLAYATRLFTEHSTTKKEKINILRRFDSVESLKESKQLYKTVKDELSKVEGKSINESVETKLNNQMSSGSSTSLIESKTYENPQFLRIKDLMAKM